MKTKTFLTYFKQLQDPRIHINKLNEINTILLISVIAIPYAELKHGSKWKSFQKPSKI
jgi:hypothetical protein